MKSFASMDMLHLRKASMLRAKTWGFNFVEMRLVAESVPPANPRTCCNFTSVVYIYDYYLESAACLCPLLVKHQMFHLDVVEDLQQAKNAKTRGTWVLDPSPPSHPTCNRKPLPPL